MNSSELVPTEAESANVSAALPGEQNFGWWTMYNYVRVTKIFVSGLDTIEANIVAVNTVPPDELSGILSTLFGHPEIQFIWRIFRAVIDFHPTEFVQRSLSLMGDKLHAFKLTIMEDYLLERFEAMPCLGRDKMKLITAILIGLNWTPARRGKQTVSAESAAGEALRAPAATKGGVS